MRDFWRTILGYLIKLLAIGFLILIERVIGWPVLAVYLVWRLGTGASLSWRLLSFVFASLLISGVYGVSAFLMLLIILSGSFLVSIQTLSQQRLLRVLVMSGWLVVGMIFLGVGVDQRSLLYLSLQVLILILLQIPLSAHSKLKVGRREF